MAVKSPAITLRRMTVEDVPAVYELDTLSFSLPWTERSFAFEVTENPNARTWVVEIDHDGIPRLVGMLVLWIFLDEAHIATLAVHPDFRRQGIAGHLLRMALNSAYADGTRHALLEVRAGNQVAREMYEKLGFAVVGFRHHYYHDNDEDALLMTLENLVPRDPGDNHAR